MTLDDATCRARVEAARHGVLATVHPTRGVDVVPVVFAVVDGLVIVPVDTLKAKSGARLQRLRNLDRDPRCALLVEEYDEDWTRLWWVRVHGTATEETATDAHLAALADRYEPYRAPGAVASLIVLRPDAVTGWAAG